jgi:hypothetical protein
MSRGDQPRTGAIGVRLTEGVLRSALFDNSGVVGREHSPTILESYNNHTIVYVILQTLIYLCRKTMTVPEPM